MADPPLPPAIPRSASGRPSRILPPMSRKQKTERTGRLKQIRTAYQMTRKADPRIGRILLVTGLGTLLVFVLAGVLLHQVVFLSILGVPFAVLIAMTVFGRRAERTAYAQVEGQPGAAAAVVQNIRRGWTIEPGVAVTRNYDIVHRAVGRPGIVLIGEG